MISYVERGLSCKMEERNERDRRSYANDFTEITHALQV